MKRTITTTLAALLMSTAAYAVEANKSKVLYTNDKTFWNVQHHTYSDNSAEQCTIATSWGEAGGKITSTFILKFNSDSGLTWNFGKSSWRMKPGNQVMSIITVDGNSWSGYSTVDNPKAMAGSFSDEQASSLMEAIRHGKRIAITFPNGTETPFGVKIDHKAFTAFSSCSASVDTATGGDAGEEAPEQPKAGA